MDCKFKRRSDVYNMSKNNCQLLLDHLTRMAHKGMIPNMALSESRVMVQCHVKKEGCELLKAFKYEQRTITKGTHEAIIKAYGEDQS